MILTTELLVDLSLSHAKASLTTHFTQADQWKELGHDDGYVWGTHTYGYSNIETVIDLAVLRVGATSSLICNCSYSHPCTHSLALWLLFTEHPEHFKQHTQPDFVQRRAEQKFSERKPEGDALPDIQRGLAQLELWLTNKMRRGLADPMIREFRYWDVMAERMLAAWMPGISQWLREIANIPVRGGRWTEPLLDELGRLYLLVKSFKRYDQLPSEIQADLREVVGWRLTWEEMQTQHSLRDDWVVIGQRRRTLLDNSPEQIVWLYGQQSERVAVVHDVGSRDVLNSIQTTIGNVHNLSLAYRPSRTPLKAVIVEEHGVGEPVFTSGGTIHESISEYGTALAANPWLKYYPLMLKDVYVARFGKGWIVRHADGTYLPIAYYFRHKWVLYAASSGRPITIAGVWNGNSLFPLSLITPDNRFIDLNHVIPYKRRDSK